MDMVDSSFSEDVAKIYDNCIDNLLLLTSLSPFVIPHPKDFSNLATTYLMILGELDALSDDEDDNDSFIGECSDDFICDECAEADEGESLYASEEDIISDNGLFVGRTFLSDRDALNDFFGMNEEDKNEIFLARHFPNTFSHTSLNDMPPIIICGFGLSEN